MKFKFRDLDDVHDILAAADRLRKVSSVFVSFQKKVAALSPIEARRIALAIRTLVDFAEQLGRSEVEQL